jgi:hypothetical protein
MTLYCAIDHHSNNNVPVVIDDAEVALLEGTESRSSHVEKTGEVTGRDKLLI